MGRCSSREEFRIFRILALDPITGRIRKGIPWNLVPFPILLLLSVPRSFCLVCNQNLVNSSKFWWTGLRGFARRHRPPAWQYNNLIRSHIHGKPSGRFPWGDHTGVHLMKTNSTFLRGWGIYRNDSKCRPHVARVVSSTTTPPPTNPRLVCISWHETITPLPCNWNEQYFPLANSPTFPVLRMHRSISNEAFLNFPRIPTDRNYPFSPRTKPPLSFSFSSYASSFQFLSLLFSFLSFSSRTFIPFHRFSNGDDGIFQWLESRAAKKEST